MEEGEVEEEGFDVSGVEAKPGNSQASVLTAQSQKARPVNTHSPCLSLDGDSYLARLLLFC